MQRKPYRWYQICYYILQSMEQDTRSISSENIRYINVNKISSPAGGNKDTSLIPNIIVRKGFPTLPREHKGLTKT